MFYMFHVTERIKFGNPYTCTLVNSVDPDKTCSILSGSVLYTSIKTISMDKQYNFNRNCSDFGEQLIFRGILSFIFSL